MVKALIFDFDGVIVDSIDIKTKAFASLFSNEGEAAVDKIVSYHLKNAGVSRFDKFRHIYKEILRRDLSERTFKDLCSEFAGLVMDNVIKAPYVKGAKEFLEAYSSNIRCFVVSATPQGEIEEIIKKRALERFFLRVYGSPVKKTEAVKEILEKENLRAMDSFYIGDALSDYNAAKVNYIRFIALTSGTGVFSKIDCLKIRDLTELTTTIGLE